MALTTHLPPFFVQPTQFEPILSIVLRYWCKGPSRLLLNRRVNPPKDIPKILLATPTARLEGLLRCSLWVRSYRTTGIAPRSRLLLGRTQWEPRLGACACTRFAVADDLSILASWEDRWGAASEYEIYDAQRDIVCRVGVIPTPLRARMLLEEHGESVFIEEKCGQPYGVVVVRET
jgi:hypothetical protein